MFFSISWTEFGFTGNVDEIHGFGLLGMLLEKIQVDVNYIAPIAVISYIVLAIIAYFIGNISPSTLLARAKGIDIKKEGSGNAGTTNALRVMGPKAGVITLVVDIVKGLVAVLLGTLIAGHGCAMFCVDAVVVGHIWPVIYKFKGGKGVATTYGALMALDPLLGMATLGVVLVSVLISKRMSVGSIMGAVCFPFLCLFIEPDFIILGVVLAVVVFVKHRANLGRIIRGEEPKLGFLDKDKKKETEE